MSMLDSVSKGKIKRPVSVVLYGPDGVGKSTFGATAPKPIFLGTEKGTSNLDVSRFPSPKNFSHCLQAIDELINEKHDYQTLVIDSLDWLEPMLWKQICESHGVDSIEKVLGGYGKGYTIALDFWHQMIAKIEALRETKKMHIIALAHSMIKNFQDPTTSAGYDRYQLKLNDKASALWREAVEAVLFANYEVFTSEKSGKTKAHGDGARVIYTEYRPAYSAKNRYGLPNKMPLSWTDFFNAYEKGEPESAEKLKESIKSLLIGIQDLTLAAKVAETVEKAGDNVANLEMIKNRLMARLEN